MKKTTQFLIKKVIISFVSLIFFLVLLEIGLRLAGSFYFYNSLKRLSPQEVIRKINDSPECRVILCVGDSFTFGSPFPYKLTYPGLLEELLNAKNAGKKFIVVNEGKCEYNSRLLLKFLSGWINIYHPDTIVLLVGSANRFNLWPYNSNITKGPVTFLKSVISELRIFKMARIIVLNLKQKSFHWDFDYIPTVIREVLRADDGSAKPIRLYSLATRYFVNMSRIRSEVKGDPLSLIWVYYNNGNTGEALQLCKKLLKDNIQPAKTLCIMASIYMGKLSDYQSAHECLTEALKNNPEPIFHVWIYRKLGFIYLSNRQYARAIDWFCKSIEVDPFSGVLYYLLARTYELQSERDANYIILKFQGMIKANPDLRKNQLFMLYYTQFQDKKKLDIKIDELLESDLEAIIRICRNKNIRLIIQNYPTPYIMANSIIEKTAERNSLPLVDNYTVFNKFISGEKRKDYILDDDHCTVKGNWVMAGNVYKALSSSGIIKE